MKRKKSILKSVYNEAIKSRDEAAAQQRSLAAKLNAIVLVLRGDN